MKAIKKLAVILVLATSTTLFGQGVELTSYLEGGYYSGLLSWNGPREIITVDQDNNISKSITEVYQSTGIEYENKLYTEMYFGAKWKGFTLETSLFTIIRPRCLTSFSPLQTNYDIGVSYRYKNIEVLASHLCTHSTEFFKIGGGYTKAGVRVYIINK